MGTVILRNQVTANGAFEAPSPETWLELDADSGDDSLRQLTLGDALVLGRRTYEGLAEVWPRLVDDPDLGRYAPRINTMPKYVASRTLDDPLGWNATLLHGDPATAVRDLKGRHRGNLLVIGCGELAHTLAQSGLVDEYWFWVNPHLWPTGPRILDGIASVRLALIAATPYRSGVVWLRYRPA